MNTLVAAVLVASAACRVSGTHFIGDDAGGGDDGSDASGPTTRAYLLDGTSGIWPLARGGAAGFVFDGPVTPLTGARSSTIGHGMLYVVHVISATNNESSIARYMIGPTGDLALLDETPLVEATKPCLGERIAISPDGKWLAVGCSDSFVVTIAVSADGVLGAVHANETASINTPIAPAWSNDSKCVYVADSTSGATDVFAFTLLVDGTLTDASASPYFGPVGASAVTVASDGDVYIAGNAVYVFTPKPASCALMPDVQTTPFEAETTIVLSPAQNRVYTAGHSLRMFDSQTLAPDPNYPAIALDVGGAQYASAVFDANDLYLVAQAHAGVYRVQLDAQGLVTTATLLTGGTNTPNPVWMQLLP